MDDTLNSQFGVHHDQRCDLALSQAGQGCPAAATENRTREPVEAPVMRAVLSGGEVIRDSFSIVLYFPGNVHRHFGPAFETLAKYVEKGPSTE